MSEEKVATVEKKRERLFADKPYKYFKVEIKFSRMCLGTNSKVSIYKQWQVDKTKKALAQLNKMRKGTKDYMKYLGTEITEDKEKAEVIGFIRKYCEMIGRVITELPTSIEDLYKIAVELEHEVEDKLKGDPLQRATGFLRDRDGNILLSTHQLIGNFKDNCKKATGSTNEDTPKNLKAFASKVETNDVLALDVRPVEQFFTIVTGGLQRNEDGTPFILERPISFDNGFGKKETAIAMSEVLQEGTVIACTLRVRSNSPIIPQGKTCLLEDILSMGRNQGLGQWRSSGGMGAYNYRISELVNYTEPIPEGWN